MTDRLPYEEQIAQQWNDLPLPDENMAWADMKRRLEEDDDRGIIPFWLRGCGLWSLVALLLIGLGWWFIRPDKWWNKKEITEKVESVNQQKDGRDNSKNNNTLKPGDTLQIINNSQQQNTSDSRTDKPNDTTALSKKQGSDPKRISSKKDNAMSVDVINAQPGRRKRQPIKASVKTNNPPQDKPRKKPIVQPVPGKTDDQTDISVQAPGVKDKKSGVDPTEPVTKPVLPRDSLTITSIAINKTDSVKNVSPDSTMKKTPEPIATKENEAKKDSSKRGKISFSAGIAEQQLLPIGGQKLTPYNSLGRKGSLADYIPSVYFRMHKDNKWFLQAEFKYGAPQYNKEFRYEDNIKVDIVGQDTITTATSSTLKKTFYHQVPLTFNYFVLPNWSVGTGIIWNKFVNAVSERDLTEQLNSGSPDTLLLGAIIRDNNTSVFAKSYLHAVIETQYRWKRFSFGARYAFGLQPYIRFTLAGGTEQQEKNRSLHIFLRYELWKSGKKKKTR